LRYAKGRVLEVGYGSGINFEHYDPKQVTELVAVRLVDSKSIIVQCFSEPLFMI